MEQGAWVASASATTALAVALGLRRRLPGVVIGVALVAAGAGLGWGGMLMQPAPSTVEFAAAIGLLAIMVPAHARVVLGPFGPAR